MNARDPRGSFGYSYEARVRIAKLGTPAINEFLNELSLADKKHVYGCLPAVSGFRPDSERELKEKAKRLLAAVSQIPDTRSRIQGPEWSAFGVAWASWGQRHFKSNFPEPPYEFAGADENLAKAFVEKLIPSENASVCRENLERLLLFSGLPTGPQLTALLQSVPTMAALEQSRRAAQIPVDVELLKKAVATHDEKFAELRDKVDDAHRQAAGIFPELDRAEKTLTDLTVKLGDHGMAASELELKFLALGKAADASLAQLTSSVEAVRLRLRLIESNMVELTDKLPAIGETINRFEESSNLLPSRVTEAPATAIEAAATATHRDRLRVVFASRQMTQGNGDEPAPLTDGTTALAALHRNFSVIGVRKTECRKVALSILAGVSTGQLVQFAGSLAEVLASAAASALSGARVLSWRVPLGLSDSHDGEAVMSALRDEMPESGCLLLIGANKSALEIYGDDFVNHVSRRQLEIATGLEGVAFLATLASGAGTMPGGAEFAAVGPLINADDLTWVKVTEPTKAVSGQLHRPSWTSLFKTAPSDEESDEVLRGLSTLGPPNKLWERLARNALLALRGLAGTTDEQYVGCFLQHWVGPWAKSNGMEAGEFRKVLEKFDSAWFDERRIAEATRLVWGLLE